jgi:hypothetical protein
MLYELRVYHATPGRLPDLLKRFETTTVRLFGKHGIRQLGFWTVAIGEASSDLNLHPAMGIAGRARSAVRDLSERSRMD